MVIVVPDEEMRLGAIDAGRAGAFASVDATVDLQRESSTAPVRARQFIIWLVIPENAKEARDYEALKELDTLP